MNEIAYRRHALSRALWPGLRAFWGQDGAWDEACRASERRQRREDVWRKRHQRARRGYKAWRWQRVDQERVPLLFWHHDRAERTQVRLWRLRARRFRRHEQARYHEETRREYSFGIEPDPDPNRVTSAFEHPEGWGFILARNKTPEEMDAVAAEDPAGDLDHRADRGTAADRDFRGA